MLVYDVTYDGAGLHNGGTGTLFINGKKVGEGRIDNTQGAVGSLAGETADVGIDAYSPVTDDYDPWNNVFSGTIHKIVVKHKHAAGTGRPRATVIVRPALNDLLPSHARDDSIGSELRVPVGSARHGESTLSFCRTCCRATPGNQCQRQKLI